MVKLQSYKNTDYQEVIKLINKSGVSTVNVWDSKENYSSMVKKDKQAITIAIDNKQIIGVFMLIYFGSMICLMYRLAVDKNYRNKGVGSLLLAKAEEIAKKKNVKKLGFYVEAKNKKLINYYKKRKYDLINKEYNFMWKTI